MEANEPIAMETFDREYELAELFPRKLAADMLNDLGARRHAAIVLPSGEVYWGQAHHMNQWLAGAMQALAANAESMFIDPAGDGPTVVFPLRHELENIGYLVIQADDPAVTDDLVRLGRFAARAIEHTLLLSCRSRMVAGLHGQVVEESYARLKEKVEQLRESEEKYRALALNLEKEVARKAEEIKATQLALLQQEKMAAIGRLAAGVAHEINNPIGFVLSNLSSLRSTTADVARLMTHFGGLAERVCREPALQPDHDDLKRLAAEATRLGEQLDIDFLVEDMQALITESIEGAERVKTIVQHLRDFAHPSIETVESVDIHHCLETTLAILGGQIGPRVAIRKRYGDIPTVRGRLRELNQVFFQLLRNAIQAVSPSGEIVLSTCVLDDRQVEVAVADTGPGIDKNHLGRIFDPFFTTREVGAGTGLGLYLAYSIMHKHGGTITAQSTEGAGSTFRVRLPVM